MNKSFDAIKVLIVLNVIIFVLTYIGSDVKTQMYELLSLYLPANDKFGYWQFVTSIFMHGSITHLLFNMYALWAFGTPLEQIWHVKRFVTFYFLCGIGAGIVYSAVNYYQFSDLYNELINAGVSIENIEMLLNTGQYDTSAFSVLSGEELQEFYDLYHTPAVGASGAIYGILVAFGIMFPNAKLALIFLPFPIPAKYFIPILIGLDLFSGVTGFSIFGGGIAHFAHVGGALIGFLLMMFWRKHVKRPYGYEA